jgi:RNA polymerase sigma-70 factor (ECF subfamily)
MRDIVLSDDERFVALAEADRTFVMTEDEFRSFYERTARPVWAYLARATGDGRLAEDLLQETYYRFLRARAAFESDDHQRHYLFRIATNLVRDHRRAPRWEQQGVDALSDVPAVADAGTADRAVRRMDLTRAMRQMKPRERSLLWLAYAQGFSHDEIAGLLHLKTSSLKVLLFRARRRLLDVLGGRDDPGGVR